MNVLLIRLPVFLDTIQPPLGLGYIASSLTGNNNVKILDCPRGRITNERFRNAILKYKPDVVGIQCYSYGIDKVKKYLEIIKSTNPEIITVVGGPHPTVLLTQTFEYFGDLIDYAIVGEAERAFNLLIKNIESREDKAIDIKGVAFKNNGRLVYSRNDFIEDLDSLSFPEWKLIPPNKYPSAPQGAFYKKFPVAPIITSRGCPYVCTFCSAGAVSGRTIRYRTVDNVIEELKYLKRYFGVNEIHIIDDNFTFNKEYVMTFCEEILANGLKFFFACPNGVRINSLNTGMLKLMKKAGFYSVSLGIETGSESILKSIKKGVTLDLIEEKVNLLYKAGIDAVGFFIIGFVNERKQDIDKTIKFSKALKLSRANFMLYHPMPGSEDYEFIADNYGIGRINFQANSFAKVAFINNGISPGSLKRHQLKAFICFYMRFKQILYMIKSIKSVGHLYYITLRLKRWIFSQ